MDRKTVKDLAKRAHALGEARDLSAVPELIGMHQSAAVEVRRMAVSALGKLAGLANAADVIPPLQARLRDSHAQVRQYAIKALSAYGAASRSALADLKDISENQSEKDYNRRDAAKAIDTIQEACRIAIEESRQSCLKCNQIVDADEYARSMRAFQRVYYDACFNEVYLRRRNFDTQVELNKTIPTDGGQLVQSDGERIIADFLKSRDIAYRYDERMQIIEGYAIRPDFYLPEFDVYIEYWGMDTAKFKIGMLKKQEIYQQQGKRLISLGFQDKPPLREKLDEKLKKYIRPRRD